MADANSSSGPQTGDSPRGFAFALTAYVLWGFLPFFMKAVAHIPAAEVVAHRIIWSVPLAGLVLVWLGRTADIKAALRSPRMLGMATLTAVLITINWGIYVWAIGAGRAIETALGYYVNPLFSIFLGAVLLKEKLDRAQIVAIALAAVAVAILAFDAGGLPWVSLSLCVSWAFYAFCRKALPIGPNQGFFLEVLILSVPAIGYVIWLESTGQGHFGDTGMADVLWLLSCGIVTAVPLMVYANGAKLLRLSTIGIMQYIAPTMIFIIAVFAFGEPFGTVKLIAFVFIWAALFIYSGSMLRSARNRRLAAAEVKPAE
ncbi:EamA family transporter RarD [Shinella sp. AETb1-6]|jgi:chloramphenicol-sensitive protein RarD|uniref:EamA family transporter RarD n=2 Tax=Shinella TaxID=323620 RepID=A0AA50HGV7_9HYPH|nr:MULTISPECIES: EamA family transporter RarD [Shinella]MDP9589705.1 chloramphenicol-sensitive protein RarD [Shinella zoogloeoides]MCD1264161.1 EamA family transporter RarD [Shinella sumterensis]MXN53873.1 EamA family transporter RarD [Shinella sp. AETb1-6]TFE97637.1 EamA family transporter [Shinella sumterensis]WLR95898.1 EamA family transporter RarD [Shinella sumterensis]